MKEKSVLRMFHKVKNKIEKVPLYGEIKESI